jgi:hypothetical protein
MASINDGKLALWECSTCHALCSAARSAQCDVCKSYACVDCLKARLQTIKFYCPKCPDWCLCNSNGWHKWGLGDQPVGELGRCAHCTCKHTCTAHCVTICTKCERRTVKTDQFLLDWCLAHKLKMSRVALEAEVDAATHPRRCDPNAESFPEYDTDTESDE